MADLERIFSQLDSVKNEFKNQMRSEIVNAILGICAGLLRNKQCPHNYELSIDDDKQLGQLLCMDVEVEDINDSNLLDLVFTSR